MPTKTKQINSSPLTLAPMIAASLIKGGVAGVGNILQERKAAKAAGEDYSFKEGVGDFLQGTASGMTGIDFTDQEQAPKNIVRSIPADFSSNENPSLNEVPTSGDISPEGNPAVVQGIDPSQSQLGGLFAPAPIKMKKPRTKDISPVEMNYAPLKMSANQFKNAGLMMNISGAGSLSGPGDEKTKPDTKGNWEGYNFKPGDIDRIDSGDTNFSVSTSPYGTKTKTNPEGFSYDIIWESTNDDD